MSLRWFRGRIHWKGLLCWCWGMGCWVLSGAKMAALGLCLGSHGIVLAVGQGTYFYTLAESYCKWVSARYLLHREPSLAVMGRFIGMPFERLNAKRVSGQTLPRTGPEMFTTCETVVSRISGSVGWGRRHKCTCTGVCQWFIGIKKKEKTQLPPAPTGTVHAEVSSCTFKNVLVRLTATKSKV